mgnify:CR=1 FL=1
MKQDFLNLKIKTNGQKLYEFTDKTNNWIKENNFNNGIINFRSWSKGNFRVVLSLYCIDDLIDKYSHVSGVDGSKKKKPNQKNKNTHNKTEYILHPGTFIQKIKI